ncbi:MAG TPA: hypothetical protein VE196_05020, partial [Pseudonocardiaceae bacterium]|nr:hypothetical protein [Pseudonocardiaceae bacterium]
RLPPFGEHRGWVIGLVCNQCPRRVRAHSVEALEVWRVDRLGCTQLLSVVLAVHQGKKSYAARVLSCQGTGAVSGQIER